MATLRRGGDAAISIPPRRQPTTHITGDPLWRGMGFGGTAKKIQTVVDLAEKVYDRLNHLVSQVKTLQEQVETASDRVDENRRALAEQRALLEAIAAEQGLDVDAVLEDVELPDGAAEGDGDAAADAESATEGAESDAADATADGADATADAADAE